MSGRRSPSLRWSQVPEKEQGRTVDRLLHGRAGALGCLRHAEWRLRHERPRADLIRKALLRAADLYAAAQELGWSVARFEDDFAAAWAALNALDDKILTPTPDAGK